MANQPYSPTAGAPSGSIFGGPLRVLPDMGTRADTSSWAVAYPLGPFIFENKVSNSSSNMVFAGRVTSTMTRIVAVKPGIIVGVGGSRSTTPTAGTWQVKGMI